MKTNDYKIRIENESKQDPKFSIYEINDDLYIPTPELQQLLINGLVGKKLIKTNGKALPARSRSKAIKTLVCKALGYPVPKSFKKTQPRFPCQDFDTYGQASNNLQIWNEPVHDKRRYVILKISNAEILKIRIINGAELKPYVHKDTLTYKHQASVKHRTNNGYLLSDDTDKVKSYLTNNINQAIDKIKTILPTSNPTSNTLLPINVLFNILKPIIGTKLKNLTTTDTRGQGDIVHQLMVKTLGYPIFKDDGQFPDINNQLLEVKAQESPTIDFGKDAPANNKEILPSSQLNSNSHFKEADCRYAIACIKRGIISGLYIVTGASMFNTKYISEIKGLNGKIQIGLPKDFFN